MGSDESKTASDQSNCENETWPATRRVSNPNQCAPWTLLHQCSLEQWKSGHSDGAGFQEPVLVCEGTVHKDCSPTFCINRQGIINVNKTSSIFSFRKRSKFTKMVEHFEYNHIPAQLSSIQNFHVRSVLCHSEHLVILHLVRNMATQFGLIDLKENKFLGIFGKQKEEVFNEAIRGQITPNKKMCLIKVPSVNRGNIQLQLYELFTKSRSQLACIELPVDDSHFVFDPRFELSRIAVTNFDKNSYTGLCLVRTDTWQVIAKNSTTFDTDDLRELMYSPDGSLIVAVTMGSICYCKYRKRNIHHPINIAVYVLNSDTVEPLHCIKYQRYTCAIHCCPINYLPLFSACGNRLAITVNKPGLSLGPFVQVYKLPSSTNLQNLCRIKVLQTYKDEEINDLPLPIKLKTYLRFQPEYN